MKRRNFIRNTIVLGVASHPFVNALARQNSFSHIHNSEFNGLKEPVFVYNNWSAYDELSDNVAQTETLAMRELNEVIRLKKNGVKIDYYVMDAFWFAKDGGYRIWHTEHWPNGPEQWLNGCKENDIKPGMWFSTNLVSMGGKTALDIIPAWKDSVGTDPNILCLFDGGYLNHLSSTLQIWYDKGVRLFKFDFAYFEAVTASLKSKFSPEEIKEKNKTAFMKMLQDFRAKNNDVVITGYNGFGGDMENTFTPFDKKIDSRWLDTFDTLYCGDPRFSDVPMMNLWRSQDNYSDHQVSAYHAYGMPINRIDNCAFMIGKTGTCYYRANHCWKGMLILELARGGWMNVYHGNLELLSDADAKWFAKTQSLFHPLQRLNSTETFGAVPGKGKPYGFKAASAKGMVCTVINPSQQIATIELPANFSSAKILYTDGGFKPKLKGNEIILGAEQMAVVGFGEYANEKYDLGVDETINIPLSIKRAGAVFVKTKKNTIEGTAETAAGKNTRIILQQFDSSGLPHRVWGESPPNGRKMDSYLGIIVTQNGNTVPMHIEYNKMIWSGLSWAAVEIDKKDIEFAKPLHIQCYSNDEKELSLKAEVYEVGY